MAEIIAVLVIFLGLGYLAEYIEDRNYNEKIDHYENEKDYY